MKKIYLLGIALFLNGCSANFCLTPDFGFRNPCFETGCHCPDTGRGRYLQHHARFIN